VIVPTPHSASTPYRPTCGNRHPDPPVRRQLLFRRYPPLCRAAAGKLGSGRGGQPGLYRHVPKNRRRRVGRNRRRDYSSETRDLAACGDTNSCLPPWVV